MLVTVTVTVTVTVKLHALLPQVRKECRVIKGLLLDNISIDISRVCKNIDRLWVTVQCIVHWSNTLLIIIKNLSSQSQIDCQD